jgi:OOP family OmpA-OmpF porin
MDPQDKPRRSAPEAAPVPKPAPSTTGQRGPLPAHALTSLRRTPQPPAVTAVAALAMSLPFGCVDRSLPPTPPPDPNTNTPLPGWFDENARWNPNGSDSQVYIEGKIIFDTASARIRPESEATLQRLLAFLIQKPEVTRLRIEGHTDSRASDEYNQELSAKRSLAVCDWLVDHGIDNLRLIAVGFGEQKPIAPNELAAGRQENRRTEFHVHEVNGRAFSIGDPLKGGMILDVLTAEERERIKHPPKPYIPPVKPFHPTGNETHPVSPPKPKNPDTDPVLTTPVAK